MTCPEQMPKPTKNQDQSTNKRIKRSSNSKSTRTKRSFEEERLLSRHKITGAKAFSSFFTQKSKGRNKSKKKKSSQEKAVEKNEKEGTVRYL